MKDPGDGGWRRGFGTWRGSVGLPGNGPVPAVIDGWRRPSPRLVSGIAALPGRWPSLAARAVDLLRGEARDAGLPDPGPAPDGALLPRGAVPVHVVASMRRNGLALEIAIGVEWDEEHPRGLLVEDWVVASLCGSVRSR